MSHVRAKLQHFKTQEVNCRAVQYSDNGLPVVSKHTAYTVALVGRVRQMTVMPVISDGC